MNILVRARKDVHFTGWDMDTYTTTKIFSTVSQFPAEPITHPLCNCYSAFNMSTSATPLSYQNAQILTNQLGIFFSVCLAICSSYKEYEDFALV